MVNMSKRLEIAQTWAKIGLKQTPPKLRVNQRPNTFKLEQIDGKLTIEDKAAEIKIDMSKVRAQLDCKNNKIYSKDIARKGYQESLKGIAEYAAEGDALAAIERKGNPLIAQARKRSFDKDRDIGLKWKVGPEFKVTPNKLDITFKNDDIDGIAINTEPGNVGVDLDWGKIDIYQKQLPKLEIRAVDTKV
ncbi:hypothetical protein BX659_104127 [Orenia metallireducens]|uniref:Uncharacterized protein n=1 Tax=Orenia metallireducens TaxID=1413210 RepID=A0A285GB37_9FIRM|nr:DUF6470 family protein [Orenia metallireducens]PRX32578.1 hypothetical protein BX659_104127 [Orenia metallireducens]SNY20789.1 hypothetical protein SAMN06265827_10621 [Orenia metallireducens]